MRLFQTTRSKIILFLSAGLAATFWFSLPSPLFRTPTSTVIDDSGGRLLSAVLASDEQWRFPAPDTVAGKFRQSIIYFEDEYFYWHPGINPVSMLRAAWQNISDRSIVSGGSTLSMQVIRLSRPPSSRGVLTKLKEMILALRLELSYSKNEILTLYATHAPFGGNVLGLEAAAWRYYGRPAGSLSWGETAALAVLPNAPSLVYPGKNETIYRAKRNRLLDKLHDKGIIDETTCSLAKDEPLPARPRELPRLAPHLLTKLQKEASAGSRIQTTIDRQLQLNSLSIVQKYHTAFSGNHIHNIAVVILDTRSGALLTYIGNPGETGQASFVDNASSLRSPGSLLKPFLYAAMLQEGLLLPSSLVSDIPTRYGSYKPDNFEKSFTGAVPAGEALARSLNIPAVRELHEYGIVRFHSLLKQLGYTALSKPAEHYGLSLILGGSEITLTAITALYAEIGRAVLNAKGSMTTTSPIDPAAWWCTLEALSSVNRPHSEMGWEYFSSSGKTAWKTGTSVGSRDAWSIGVTPAYTIGVWVGNSSGEGRPGLTGISHAAPLMFELFKSLTTGGWFERPMQNIIQLKVCKKSGFRAGPQCEATDAWVPANGVKAAQCPYHRKIFTDASGNFRVNANCYPVSQLKSVAWFVLPPAQEYYYRQLHPDYRSLPPIKEGCETTSESPMDLLIPDNNSALFIPRGIDGQEGQLIFEAVHRQPQTRIFWHIDEQYLGETRGQHKMEYLPTPGDHVVVIQDEQGNILKRRFTVLKP